MAKAETTSDSASQRISEVLVTPVDFADKAHADAFIALLDHYASGESGGNTPLREDVRSALPERLAVWPGYMGFLAWYAGKPVGLINCFTGFSTFKAMPLLNVHDVVVHSDYRRLGIARRMFVEVEQWARSKGYCKVTLEVLANNAAALRAYQSFGFRPYELDPAMGAAQLYEKAL